MAFKQRSPEPTPASDPEELYRGLAGRNGAPPALWVHQGDVLRQWHERYQKAADIAIELPTGAGKTLVGALIGEWRRQALRERVAYLCPTRQLAQQTFENLLSYGMPAVLLTGRVRSWDSADRTRYSSGRAIAVSVYSHVFNSNPALDDVQALILDDAHAAESYVAAPWRLGLDRDTDLYLRVLATLEQALDPLILSFMQTGSSAGTFAKGVYLASPAGVAAVAAELETVLDLGSEELSDDAKHALALLRGHVGRCLVYVSYRRVEIRPMIPPTGTHPAFDLPRQRIYMSATLGSGGELERAFGRRKIGRIPVPKGWDKQGTGRRFFCFPELTTDLSGSPAKADKWISDTIGAAKRAVVLTPESRVADVFVERRCPSDFQVYRAHDIEADLNAFSRQTESVLVLTNRYDGIDLPDDDCRMVVLQGLPARGDLQERFLSGSLGALEVLQERLRARIVQGAGRATRNSGDYALVVVAGNDLVSFCSRRDVMAALHPEVQAELSFGLDESLGISSDDLSENVAAFLSQDADWRRVEGSITADRDTRQQHDPPGAMELERSAPFEVRAWLAAWEGDWRAALDFARQSIDALRGGQAPQRYAALWNYFAACWSAQLAEEADDQSIRDTSSEYMSAARASGRGTAWLSHLVAPSDADRRPTAGTPRDPLDTAAARSVVERFERLGRPVTFDRDIDETSRGLQSTNPREYEPALIRLGELVGAEISEGDRGADAAPDAAWLFGDILWVCWEAKSDAQVQTPLSAKYVRQAGSHPRFVSTDRNEPVPSGSISLIATPQESVQPSAVKVAEDHVYRVHPDRCVDLFRRVARAWRSLRARGLTTPSEVEVLSAFHAERALPSDWLTDLTADRVSEIVT